MKPAVFHPEALAEFQEQAVFYEARSAGPGERFAAQVEAAASLAASMFPKDFPHSVVYRETADSLLILAVAPFRRKPAYWRRRK